MYCGYLNQILRSEILYVNSVMSLLENENKGVILEGETLNCTTLKLLQVMHILEHCVIFPF